MTRRVFGLLDRLLIAANAVIVALVVIEGVLQIVYRQDDRWAGLLPATIRANEPYPTILYESHPFFPYVLKPTRAPVWLNMNGRSPRGGNPGAWVDYRINSLGGRGPEIAIRKPPGVVRIAALGGSTTFSIHTREAQSWPKVLEDLLNGSAAEGVRYEVLNFGTPKATSVYSVVALATKVIQLQPDVVIAYEGINDVSTWQFPGLRPDHSHVFADMKEIPRWVESVPAAAFRSALVTFLVQRLALRLERDFGERENLPRGGRMAVEDGIAILLDHYRSMRGIAEAHSARFVTATFHVVNENDAYGRAIAALNRALLAWGSTDGVPVAELAAKIPHDDFSVHSDGAHFTAKGDRMVAEILADTLRRTVLSGTVPPHVQ